MGKYNLLHTFKLTWLLLWPLLSVLGMVTIIIYRGPLFLLFIFIFLLISALHANEVYLYYHTKSKYIEDLEP